MTAIAIVGLVTLAISFTCSLLEAVLYAVTPPQLEVLRKNEVFGSSSGLAEEQPGSSSPGRGELVPWM